MTKARKTTYNERIEIIQYCIENDYDYTGTSIRFGVSYQQVYRWVKVYNTQGVEALVDGRGRSKSKRGEIDELEKLQAENTLLKAEMQSLKQETDLIKRFNRIEKPSKWD